MSQGDQNSRTSSTHAKQKALSNLDIEIDSPIPLNVVEQQIFDEILDSKPRDLWKGVQIRQAAQYAKMILQLQNLQDQLEQEGPTIINERGNTLANPIIDGITRLNSAALNTAKHLGLSAASMGETGKVKANKKANETEAKNARSKAGVRLLA